ncbi:MAG: xanthine dehydrogenase family protein molybdopterin-binding subunit, partial [Betaproteobacteria bacterium]|nr:xanthine dehydrogenase family protein molybdopterin-binding subunit [Betaproteobacteria bacterium]
MTGTRFDIKGVVGTSVLPDEAKPLLLGEGRFINDISLPAMHHVAFLRSSHAHARLVSVDASKALAMKGVVTVLTGRELLGKVEPFRSMPNRFSGGESVQHWLAVDKVRFCGEAICAVVAESRAIAEDALELIEVEYEPLAAVTDARQGERDGAPLIHDTCPHNHLIKREYSRGDVDAAFRKADLVVERSFRLGRKQALCMEGRGCVAAYRDGAFTLTLWISHQLPSVIRHYLAKHLRLRESDVRVVAANTGGGFGQKASVYPEEFVCSYLALQLRRPVKWVE